MGSKALAAGRRIEWGPSTIRNELACSRSTGCSRIRTRRPAGCRPTPATATSSTACCPARRAGPRRSSSTLVRREVDEAMRVTTETLSQVNNLLAIVSAPPLETATVRHVEVLLLQPQVLMVVVITSTGGVTQAAVRLRAAGRPGPGRLGGELPQRAARRARPRRADARPAAVGPRRSARASARSSTAGARRSPSSRTRRGDTLYVDGAARLLREQRFQDLSQLNALMEMLERRVALLGVLRAALGQHDVWVRIGAENELPALRSLARRGRRLRPAAAQPGHGVGDRPGRGWTTAMAIDSVRDAARQLSRFVEDVYDE